MSAGLEISRDKDGFLKCKDCPRRFLTKLLFENHSCNQHKTDTEIKPNQTQMLHNIKVEKDFQVNTQFEECSFGDLSFVSQKDLQFHSSNGHQKVTPHQCSECKKLFRNEINLKEHQQNGHQQSSLQQCKKCNKALQTNLQLWICL